MKNLLILLFVCCLCSCHGNENAENKPTDVDHTKSKDSSVVVADSANPLQKDSTDTSHLNK